MTAPKRELFANAATTTLNGAINNSQTTITVTDGSVFPTTGNFRLVCNAEIMLATARSTNDITVIRGYEDTTAASHANAEDIALSLTPGSLAQLGLDNVPLWGYSPCYNRLVADDGETILTASDFTWVNQETSSVTDQNNTILLRAGLTTALDNRLLTRSAPSTPYAYIGAFHVLGPRGDATADGLFVTMGFRESSTGKFEQIEVGCNNDLNPRVTVSRWTTATSFSATVRGIETVCLVANALWFKIEDNGTNLTYYIGMDGVNWIQLFTSSRTAHMAGGPNQVFWGGRNDNNNTNATLVRLLHWSRES